jgi:hypothetical protein
MQLLVRYAREVAHTHRF